MSEDVITVDRAPIAAVGEKARVGDREIVSTVVICSDGAAFKRTKDGGWLELEPIPGTLRATQLADEP